MPPFGSIPSPRKWKHAMEMSVPALSPNQLALVDFPLGMSPRKMALKSQRTKFLKTIDRHAVTPDDCQADIKANNNNKPKTTVANGTSSNSNSDSKSSIRGSMLREWDDGNKTDRLALLETFCKKYYRFEAIQSELLSDRRKNQKREDAIFASFVSAHDLEEVFQGGVVMFLSRILSWFNLIYRTPGNASATVLCLKSILIFIACDQGVTYGRVLEDMEGFNVIFEILKEAKSVKATEDQHKCLLLLLICIRRYPETFIPKIIPFHPINIVCQLMCSCFDETNCKLAGRIVYELGLESTATALDSLVSVLNLSDDNPIAMEISAKLLRKLIEKQEPVRLPWSLASTLTRDAQTPDHFFAPGTPSLASVRTYSHKEKFILPDFTYVKGALKMLKNPEPQIHTEAVKLFLLLLRYKKAGLADTIILGLKSTLQLTTIDSEYEPKNMSNAAALDRILNEKKKKSTAAERRAQKRREKQKQREEERNKTLQDYFISLDMATAAPVRSPANSGLLTDLDGNVIAARSKLSMENLQQQQANINTNTNANPDVNVNINAVGGFNSVAAVASAGGSMTPTQPLSHGPLVTSGSRRLYLNRRRMSSITSVHLAPVLVKPALTAAKLLGMFAENSESLCDQMILLGVLPDLISCVLNVNHFDVAEAASQTIHKMMKRREKAKVLMKSYLLGFEGLYANCLEHPDQIFQDLTAPIIEKIRANMKAIQTNSPLGSHPPIGKMIRSVSQLNPESGSASASRLSRGNSNLSVISTPADSISAQLNRESSQVGHERESKSAMLSRKSFPDSGSESDRAGFRGRFQRSSTGIEGLKRPPDFQRSMGEHSSASDSEPGSAVAKVRAVGSTVGRIAVMMKRDHQSASLFSSGAEPHADSTLNPSPVDEQEVEDDETDEPFDISSPKHIDISHLFIGGFRRESILDIRDREAAISRAETLNYRRNGSNRSLISANANLEGRSSKLNRENSTRLESSMSRFRSDTSMSRVPPHVVGSGAGAEQPHGSCVNRFVRQDSALSARSSHSAQSGFDESKVTAPLSPARSITLHRVGSFKSTHTHTSSQQQQQQQHQQQEGHRDTYKSRRIATVFALPAANQEQSLALSLTSASIPLGSGTGSTVDSTIDWERNMSEYMKSRIVKQLDEFYRDGMTVEQFRTLTQQNAKLFESITDTSSKAGVKDVNQLPNEFPFYSEADIQKRLSMEQITQKLSSNNLFKGLNHHHKHPKGGSNVNRSLSKAKTIGSMSNQPKKLQQNSNPMSDAIIEEPLLENERDEFKSREANVFDFPVQSAVQFAINLAQKNLKIIDTQKWTQGRPLHKSKSKPDLTNNKNLSEADLDSESVPVEREDDNQPRAKPAFKKSVSFSHVVDESRLVDQEESDQTSDSSVSVSVSSSQTTTPIPSRSGSRSDKTATPPSHTNLALAHHALTDFYTANNNITHTSKLPPMPEDRPFEETSLEETSAAVGEQE